MYAPAYSASDIDGYTKAFKEKGYVVIENVLNPEECSQGCDEVWSYLESASSLNELDSDKNISRTDASTWTDANWPKEICRNGGFIGKFPYWKRMNSLRKTKLNTQPRAWETRQNPVIYDVISHILQRRELWVSIDRYGIMRPSNATHAEEWKTKSSWLHWDLSPFHYGTSAAGYAPNPASDKTILSSTYGSTRIQALVTLTDCPVRTGGFHCIPEFTDEAFFNWANDNRESYGERPDICRRNFIEMPMDDPLRCNATQVPMKAGSLLVWNSQLPHGNFPNTSKTDFRMVQYLKMIPVDDAREFLPAIPTSDFSLDEWFPPEFEPSELGRKLFGLQDWK